jgi:hypothetical protein
MPIELYTDALWANNEPGNPLGMEITKDYNLKQNRE